MKFSIDTNNWFNKSTVELIKIESPGDISKARDVSRNQSDRVNVLKQISERQLTRIKQDIDKWRRAVRDAERVRTTPDRTELNKVFQDVILDPHLTSVMTTRTLRCLGADFDIVDNNNEKDDDLTKLMKAEWFEKYLGFVMDARYYGYEVIQFFEFMDDAFTDVKKIPEQNVIPQKHIIKTEIFDRTHGIEYLESPWIDWIAVAGDEESLGLLNKAAPLVIWKVNVQASWSERAEIFGIPIRIGKSQAANVNTYKKMQEFLSKMGSAGWGIFDPSDEIEIIESSQSDGHKVYKEFIELINKEISKLILGQTMTTEDGSSKSQAEVHGAILDDYTKADKRFLKYNVEKELFRIMRRHGIMTRQPRFLRWDFEEKLRKIDQATVLKTLSEAGFTPENEEDVTDMVGINMIRKAQPTGPPQPPFTDPNLDPDEEGATIKAVAMLYHDK